MVTAVVARKIGPENYGAFGFALTLARYLALPAGLGVALLAMRDIAQGRSLRQVAGEVLGVQVAALILLVGPLVAAAPIVSVNDETRALIPIVALTVVALTVNFEWLLQATQRYRAIAFSRLVPQALFVTLVLVLITPGFEGTKTFAWLTFASAAVAALLVAAVALGSFGRPGRVARPAALWRRYRRGLTIGVAALMVEIFYSIDFLILGFLRGTDDVGQYYAAYRIPFALISLAALWVTVSFSQAARLYVEDRARLRAQLARALQLALVVAAPLGLVGSLAAGELMPAVFGAAYEPAAAPFALLMWATALVFVNVNLGPILLVAGEDRRYALAVSIAAALNVALNFALIPSLGTSGAALATIAAEVAVLVYCVRTVPRLLGPIGVPRRHVLKVLAATALAGATFLATASAAGLWVGLALAAGVYAAAALGGGLITRGELHALRMQLRPRG